MLNNKNCKSLGQASSKSEDGFTLVEAVVAIFVMTIGLIGTAAAITYALEFGAISRNVSSAKSVIISTFEEMQTLRNAPHLEFRLITDLGAAMPFGVFSMGFTSVSTK